MTLQRMKLHQTDFSVHYSAVCSVQHYAHFKVIDI